MQFYINVCPRTCLIPFARHQNIKASRCLLFCFFCYNNIKGNRYRLVRLPRCDYLYIYIITLRARQGDYFFPLLLSVVRLAIKEISAIVNIPKDIIRDIVWYVLITHHLPSFVNEGGNHTLLSDYLSIWYHKNCIMCNNLWNCTFLYLYWSNSSQFAIMYTAGRI